MYKKISILALVCATIFINWATAQDKKMALYSVAFYNLENLFDTIQQPNDSEYTPNGPNKWDTQKYQNKLNNMGYAISQLALERCPIGPALIGISEIENKTVVEDLVRNKHIINRNYQIVHYDSPDRRGVDVGMIYNPKLFTLEASQSRTLYIPTMPDFKTRDQLVVRGRIAGDMVHVVVNHWPSRRGGEDRSSPLREAAAALTRSISDSVQRIHPETKVIIMGDLNDDPSNKSCSVILDAKRKMKDVKKNGLYNPFWDIHKSGTGSLAYQGQWNLFDQIIISENLLGNDRSTLKFWNAEVFNRDFLKQQEGQYKGYPHRTHAGGVYLNGYSDHFPTIIYLVREVK